jgi:hypothetical protein
MGAARRFGAHGAEHVPPGRQSPSPARRGPFMMKA